jgi:hypothetical protein
MFLAVEPLDLVFSRMMFVQLSIEGGPHVWFIWDMSRSADQRVFIKDLVCSMLQSGILCYNILSTTCIMLAIM